MHESDSNPLVAALAQSKREDISPGDRRMVERCRDMALGSACGSFKAMLDKLVDELFEASEKAAYRDVQNQYMDAMTVARDKRVLIESGFRKHLLQNSERALKGLPLKGTSVKHEPDELSLVEPDELEETLAIQEMANRVRNACTQELAGLERRMGALLHDSEFQRRHNPIAPEVFVDAFMEACKDSQADIKVRLIFVMMWDKYMQNGLVTMYSEVNAYLIGKGVLPKLNLGPAKRPNTPPAPGGASDEGIDANLAATGNVPDIDVLAALQRLLQIAGTQGGAATTAAASSMMSAIPGGSAVSLLPNVVLMSQLTEMQHGQGAPSGELNAAGDAPVAFGAVSVLRDLKSGVLGESASPMESMTIDIVAMLFDFIFEDKQVPDAIKALIGRLQIPVLKAALLDQTFFSKKQHPTRKLLNALAEAAVGWGEDIDHESALYREVDAIVARVLNDFEDNLNVFVDALADFEAFLEAREHEAERLAQASAELVAKREAEQHARHNAHTASEIAVRHRAEVPALPESVREFLCQRWVEVLARAHLLGGEEGSEWTIAITLMDDLIWSVEPKMTDSERKRLVQRLPTLLRGIREGLDKAGIVPQIGEQFMSELVKLHAAAVKAGFQPAESQPQPEAAQAARPSAVILPFVVPDTSDRPLTLEIIQQPAEGDLLTEEITITGTGWSDEDETALETDEHFNPLLWQPGFDSVDELRPGVWVEFRHHGNETLQAKLKWISPSKHTYLFTDRQGKRAVTMPVDQLEAAFKLGSVRVLNEAPLVDRAVDNMLESLKKAAA